MALSRREAAHLPEPSRPPNLSPNLSPTRRSREVAAAAADAVLHPHAAEAHDGQRSPMMIDAPVSGGVPGAQAGTLTFMVS